MGKVKRVVAAWVLVVAGMSLIGGMGYIAHAESGPATWFGGIEEGGGHAGNMPHGGRHSGNRAWSGNEPEDEGGPEVPPERDTRKPIPDDESVWEDVPESELTNKERLKSRPGNFGVLETIYEFIDGTRGVEPEFRDLGFPLRQEHVEVTYADGEEGKREVTTEVIATEEDFKKQFTEREEQLRKRGKKKQNGGRKQNLFVEKIETLDVPPNDVELADPETFGLSDQQSETFKDLRKDHPEQCCLVKLTMRVESLDSDHQSTSTNLFCLVRKEDGWKICWISGMDKN